MLSQIGGGGERRRGRDQQLHGRPLQQAGQPRRADPVDRPGLRWKPCTRVEGACGSGGLGLDDRRSSPCWPRRPTSSWPSASRSRTRSRRSTAPTSWPARAGTGASARTATPISSRALQRPGRRLLREVRPREDAAGHRPLVPERRRERPAVRDGPGIPQRGCADLEALALTEPNPRSFVDHLNVFDCSKVSDGAAAIAVVSEEGLRRMRNLQVRRRRGRRLGPGRGRPDRPARRSDRARDDAPGPSRKALDAAGISLDRIGTVECHDCFTISGTPVGRGHRPRRPRRRRRTTFSPARPRGKGEVPFNTSGGLDRLGTSDRRDGRAPGRHDLAAAHREGRARARSRSPPSRPYGLSVNMGGNDKTVVAIVYKKAGRKRKPKA